MLLFWRNITGESMRKVSAIDLDVLIVERRRPRRVDKWALFECSENPAQSAASAVERSKIAQWVLSTRRCNFVSAVEWSEFASVHAVGRSKFTQLALSTERFTLTSAVEWSIEYQWPRRFAVFVSLSALLVWIPSRGGQAAGSSRPGRRRAVWCPLHPGGSHALWPRPAPRNQPPRRLQRPSRPSPDAQTWRSTRNDRSLCTG